MTDEFTDVEMDGSTTITVKRACNSCGRSLGDATEDEIVCAVAGEPLPDAVIECGCRTTQFLSD